MSYNALEKVFSINEEVLELSKTAKIGAYGLAPLTEKLSDEDEQRENLRISACRFIRDCDDLGFVTDDKGLEEYRKLLEKYKVGEKPSLETMKGKSTDHDQIPLNMQKDLDRLTFEKAVDRFCNSGSPEDAFDVYFCYLSIFFGDYRNTRDMIEMLCEFENNAGSLLMKHRDHYSHSVYVFLIGLAIYENNRLYREKYLEYYKKKWQDEGRKGVFDEKEAARHFMKFWGLTALFHDIGYPFELPFEQIKGYFSNSRNRRTAKNVKDGFVSTMPFVAYRNMQDFLSNLNINSKGITQKDLDKKISQWTRGRTVCDLTDIFALHLSDMLTDKYSDCKEFISFCEKRGIKCDEGRLPDGYDAKQLYRWYLQEILNRKPTQPETFGGFMDHAYFSAILLLHRLNEMKELKVDTDYTDSLCAILLHNSIFKFAVTNKKEDHAFTIKDGPLTYLLMLCDELQCWDRTSYGLNNRNAIYAMDCRFIFDEDKDSLTVKYVYDSYFEKRLEYCEWIKEETRKKRSLKTDLSLKDFYSGDKEHHIRGLIELDEKEYKDIYGNVYERFKDLVDNPQADLPDKMNDYLKMSVVEERDKTSQFLKDILEIVALDGKEGILMEIPPVNDKDSVDAPKEKSSHLSRSSYMHLYDFAVALNYRYNCRKNKDGEFMGASQKEMEKDFGKLSLEYQISNINQAKAFAGYLDEIGCYYTDRPVGASPMQKFEDDEKEKIGEQEHKRWWDEKLSMGWTADEWKSETAEGSGAITQKYDLKDNKWLRECTRIHADMRDYKLLIIDDKIKDKDPMDYMMRLLEEYDGLRIYRIR